MKRLLAFVSNETTPCFIYDAVLTLKNGSFSTSRFLRWEGRRILCYPGGQASTYLPYRLQNLPFSYLS